MLIQHMSELTPGGLADVGEEDISDLLVLYKCAHAGYYRVSGACSRLRIGARKRIVVAMPADLQPQGQPPLALI